MDNYNAEIVDAAVPTDCTVKQVTDAVLSKLRGLGWLEDALVEGARPAHSHDRDARTSAADVAAYLAQPEPRHLEEVLAHVF